MQGISKGVQKVLLSPKRSKDNKALTLFYSCLNSNLLARN
jgi:hypothetical protein